MAAVCAVWPVLKLLPQEWVEGRKADWQRVELGVVGWKRSIMGRKEERGLFMVPRE